ncbi:MAG: ABC transporter permease [Geminicoccaceae bacterium]|nr:ABC transporter permease [Geminicoccaceae bacterium]
MTGWFLRRLLGTALLVLLLSFLCYALIGLMPGDPLDLMLTADPKLTAADVVRLKAAYGLDRPLLARYLAWLAGAVRGDLGYSRLFARPVLDVLWPAFGRTLLLMGPSLALALGLALPLGVLAASRAGTVLDRVLNLAALATVAVPAFWLGLVLVVLFAVELRWLPAGGTAALGDAGVSPRHLVLPVLTLALATFGTFFRFVRAAVAESLAAGHIRTARAKGCGEAQVLWRHALPVAVLPVVTVFALHLGAVVSGALVVETVFAIQGMGRLVYDAIMGNDFNLALAALLLASAATLLANLLADLAYAWLDPRITYG